MGKEVIIVGGGVAGMQAALSLRERGAEPVIIEKEERLGGKLTGGTGSSPRSPLRKMCSDRCSVVWRRRVFG